jgi:hypothetical protein
MRWRITSVSVVVWKMAPSASRSARIPAASTRFPLWATAMGPR